jgi:outer membrane protein TolC
MELQLMTDSSFLFPPGAFGVFPQIGPVPPSPADLPLGRHPSTIVFGSINQPLTQLHKIGLGIDLLGTDVQIAQEQYRLQQQTVVNDVKKAYYNLLQATSALGATRDAVHAYRELVRVAGDAVQQEAALKSDLLDAQSGLAKVELDEVTLTNTVATLKENLNSLMGRDELTDFTAVEIGGEELTEVDLTAARATAVRQRAEVRQARLKIQQAELDRRMKKAEFIPEVNASLLYLSPFNVDIVPKNVAGAGLTFTWDVFDWGRKRNELDAKARTIDQAKAGADETQSRVLVEVGQMFRRLQEARAQMRVAGLARDAALEKARVAGNQYKELAIQLKDLLRVQAQQAEAQYKYREALLAFWTARADLEKAIGER